MNDNRQFRLNVLTLWVGILIPILVGLIPYGLSKLSPEHELQFRVQGPISVKRTEAVEVTVINQGSKPVRNVQVWLKAFPTISLPDSRTSADGRKSEPTDRIEIEAKVPVKASMSGEYFVLSIGDLRANEQLSVAVVSKDRALSIYGAQSHVGGIEIKSDEAIGVLQGTSVFEEFVYPFGFWMFIALMLLILVAAVYQEYLMDPKDREKMILKEIDKLKR